MSFSFKKFSVGILKGLGIVAIINAIIGLAFLYYYAVHMYLIWTKALGLSDFLSLTIYYAPNVIIPLLAFGLGNGLEKRK